MQVLCSKGFIVLCSKGLIVLCSKGFIVLCSKGFIVLCSKAPALARAWATFTVPCYPTKYPLTHSTQ